MITCALALEFNEARNQLGLEEITTKKDIPRIAQNRNITLVYTGIGKINSSIHLSKILTQSSFDLVIDSGTCGSLKENIKPFDIVISKKTIDFYNLKQRGTEFNSNYKGNILSNDTTVGSIESSITTSNSVDMLKNMGVDIVTWESAAIFAVSKNFNTEVISIRGVTDSCNGNTISDFKQNRVKVCKKLYNRIKTFCNSV
ncbi:MAG: hypothetical protein B6229_02645 [Spirochaetaceae bacterium 4572_7]|nr:MAG: hypothetical protein B6229_02645 [Spirochaetaceae bacterium 4572_7]